MLALYRAGRQAEALEVYQDARARFIDELGIEPGPELKRLQAEILRHEAGLTRARRAGATDEEGEIVKASALRSSRSRASASTERAISRSILRAFAVPDDRPSTSRARVPVRRDDAGIRSALRRAAHAVRGGRRAEAAPSLPRAASGAPARARCPSPAHRDDELRPRARACLRGGGRGARHRLLRRDRDASRPLLAPPARRGAAADRRARTPTRPSSASIAAPSC